jgi:hypothetical protein
MVLLVLLCLSVDVLIYVDLFICWCCFVYLLMLFCRSVDVRHQQIDKTTPIKPSTDEQNNINKNINRSTKQHQQIDKTTPTNKFIC